VALTGLTSRQWKLCPFRCLVAGAIVAFDPVLAAQSRSIMTETLAAFLLAWPLATLGEEGRLRVGRAAVAGLGFGLAGLCRPSTLAAASAVCLALMIRGPGSIRTRALRATVLGVSIVATLAPWALRNAQVFGEPIWTTTHGGHTLALANNPVYYDDVLNGPSGAVWSGPNQYRWFDQIAHEIEWMTEPEADRYLRAEAWRMLRDRPADFLRASLARLGRFWGVAPSDAVYPNWLRALTAAWTIPLWIALGLSLTRPSNWHWPRINAVMLLLALTGVHSVFWTDLRMRAPIVPAVALLVATSSFWRKI
jgi:hypothetical protein